MLAAAARSTRSHRSISASSAAASAAALAVRCSVRSVPSAPLSTSAPAHAAKPKANTDYLEPTHTDDHVPPDVQAKLKRHAAVTLNTYLRPAYILTRGKGCKLWDSHDREFLDFSGGIAVNALGHADEGVAKVVQDQSRKLVHSSNLWHNEWSGELAHLLVQKTKELGGMGYPANQPERNGSADDGGLKVFFTNSGTESNEGALKFVRKYGKLVSAARNAAGAEKGVTAPTDEKIEIVSFRDGFHGRSMGALSATWQDKYQRPFAPLVPGFVPATLNDIEGINAAVTEKTCGVIVEPIQVSLSPLAQVPFGAVSANWPHAIQGEGGILEASEEFLRALRRRCDEVGALLIFDEIQVRGLLTHPTSLSFLLAVLRLSLLATLMRRAVWPRTDRIVLGSRIDAGRLPPGYHHHGQAAREREHFLPRCARSSAWWRADLSRLDTGYSDRRNHDEGQGCGCDQDR